MRANQNTTPRTLCCAAAHRGLAAIAAAATMFLLVGGSPEAARGQTLPSNDTEVRTSDLIRLATSNSEALGELKIAQLKLDTLRTLSASMAVTSLEIRVAEIHLATAQQKVSFLRKIAEAELAAAKANLETEKQLWKLIEQEQPPDAPPRPSIVRAEADVAILQMILDAK
jgi:hypothetical protein